VTAAALDARLTGGAALAAGLAWPLLPEGIGPSCGFLALTGLPCPLCGMTTSVVATLQLRLGDAVAANPGGVLVVLLALVLLLRPSLLRLPPWAIPAGLGALWAVQLASP
jgi:hypothetical protein